MLDYDPRFFHYQPLYYYTYGDRGQRQRWKGFDFAASKTVLLNVSVFERQLEIFLSPSSFYPDPDRQFNVSRQGFFDGTVLNHIAPTVRSNRDIPSVLGTFTDDGVFFGDVSLPDGSSFHFMPTKGDVLLDGKAFHSIVYRKEDVRPEWGPTNWKGCAAEICSRSEDSSGASHNFSDEYIFSPNRRHDNNRTIFVGGLSKFTTVQSLYKHFLRFGTITGCRLARDKLTGASKDYGFVEFETVEQAKKASEFYSHVIDDQEVGVRLEIDKELRQKFKLFVGGLSKETSVETLREYFSKFGDIAECAIPRNSDNSSRGFGFVIFKSQESINDVLKLTAHYIDNKQVDVKHTPVRQREFTIIVKKLSPNTTDESLREFYSRFGQLTDCEVKFDRQTGQSRGFGYVGFSSQKELNSAKNAEPHIIDDVKVELEYATSEFDVLVTSLTPNITEKELNDYFSRYGKLRSCEIKESLPGVRTGFVSFWTEEEVMQALADRPHIINGRMVDIYQKDQKFVLFIGNLPFNATDDSLSKTFSKYGKLVHWHVKRDHNTNRSLGYGYVSFEKAEQAVQALNDGPHLLNGRTLRVDSNKRQTLSKKSIK
ncbi:RNA recognition motif domain-containing protein [Ditylenchus destructor]|nr:RNA recognition motif domain-containing protein [Ditylenchus destructor]